MPEIGATQARETRRVTLWGLIINLACAVMKFVFGFVGGSQALVADAVHSLSDSVTDVIVLVAAPFWTAPADEEHPHGHGRLEALVTLFIGLSLAVVGLGLGYRAVSTLHRDVAATPEWSAFIVACVSILCKEWLYHWNVAVGRRIKSSALVANAWHHRSDALSSVPVAVAVLGTQVWPTWGVLDSVATIIVSVLILHASWKIAHPAFEQLTDTGATQADRDKLMTMASEVAGVCSVHALRSRYVGAGLHVDLHVLVDPELTVREGHNVAGAVKQRLLTCGPDVIDVLVHVEPCEDIGSQ
jgi:cation diffusion facilitator family transporter